MKRPVIWFSAAFAAGVALALRSFSLPWVLALTLLAGCFLFGWKWSAFRPACVLFAGVLSGLCYTQAYHAVIQAPCAALDGTSKSMIVEVTDFPKQYDTGQRVEIRVIGSRIGCPLNFRTLAYLPKTEQDIKPGDELTATFDFYIPNQTQGFNRASYYRSQGYAILAHVNEEFGMVVTAPSHRPLRYYPKAFAQTLRAVYMQHGTERQAALWRALTTGDRTALTTTDTDHLRRAGLSHVIALSGLRAIFRTLAYFAGSAGCAVIRQPAAVVCLDTGNFVLCLEIPAYLFGSQTNAAQIEKSISRRDGKSWLFGFLRRIDDAIFAVSFWIFVCLFDFFQSIGTLGYFFAVSAAVSRRNPWHHFRAIGEHRPETGGMADRLCISNWRFLCSNPVRCAIL